MIRNVPRIALAAAVLAVFGLTTLMAGDPAKGKPLFNGKDLKGFQTKGNWMVEDDGVLTLKPRPDEKKGDWTKYGHYLWTEKKYGDFVLDLEYKHPKEGNSGVFVRTGDPVKPVDTGIEVQILDSFGKKDKLTHHDCGGIIKTQAPSKNAAKPAGEWNRMIVTCKGNNLQVNLNGEKIIDIDLSKGAMKHCPPTGHIGLQDHGEPIWFRNIKIQELGNQ
jgi:hypothetical protein